MILTILAQTNGVPVPTAPDPSSGLGLLMALVPILTPILVTILKWIVPKVPAMWLPLLAPGFGVIIDWIGSTLSHGHASPLMAAIAGAAGTGLYEIQKQVRQQVASGTSAEPPKQ